MTLSIRRVKAALLNEYTYGSAPAGIMAFGLAIQMVSISGILWSGLVRGGMGATGLGAMGHSTTGITIIGTAGIMGIMGIMDMVDMVDMAGIMEEAMGDMAGITIEEGHQANGPY